MKFSQHAEDLIADFRGLPRPTNSASGRGPTHLESLLVILEEKYKLEQFSPERVLVENWAAVFGPNLCERCHPVRIKDDHTLIISVTNQTLRSEVKFMKRSILRRIQALDGCASIKDLVVRS